MLLSPSKEIKEGDVINTAKHRFMEISARAAASPELPSSPGEEFVVGAEMVKGY